MTMIDCWYICIFFIILLCETQTLQTTSCKNQASIKGKFSIKSHRNTTGHWIMQVGLNHMAEISQNSEPWNIDINFEREKCDGGELLKFVSSISVPSPRPGPGYILMKGFGYYKFHPEAKTWHEAKNICASEGAHLAVLNSDAEAKFIKQMFERYTNIGSFVFVGFHDQYSEGEYLTVFDEPLISTGFVDWAEGQPDNYLANGTNPGEDCGSIYRDGKLNDLPCTSRVPFACEQEI